MTRRPAKSAIEKQYEAAKAAHPGAVLLFRMGDFYEAFQDDAKTLAKVCKTTLTSRDEFYMTGFPNHSLEVQIRNLLAAKLRVAICEVTE